MNDHNEEWQRALLNHPAIKPPGIDPIWRWIAALGWLTSAILVAFSK